MSAVFDHENVRWLVIEHAGRFCAYVARYRGPDIDGGELVPIDPATLPCLIPAADGIVVAWHALNNVGFPDIQLVRYDWSTQNPAGAFTVVTSG